VSVTDNPAPAAPRKHARQRRFWRRLLRQRSAQLALFVLGVVAILAIFAPWIAPYQPQDIDLFKMLSQPDGDHWLGTDENGRDIFSRLIYGGRVSLTVGLAAVAAAVLFGAVLGAVAGYLGGWVDSLISRLIDGMLSIPLFFFLLTTLALFGSNLPNLILVIAASTWMPVARIVRGEITALREMQYVEAATAIGVSKTGILFRHLLPQAVPSIIVAATLGVADAIMVESALSYLGFGIRPPTPSWGNMLAEARGYIFQNPMMSVYPGMLIFVCVLAFNTLGDALRDATDPRK
jgi:peptide/nickel transport system permease protein